MSVTTKTGDKGRTSLYFGGRVPKDHIRIEFYGTLDELCSFLGLAKAQLGKKKERDILESLQRDLFVIGAELATKTQYLNKLERKIDKGDIAIIDEHIAAFEKSRSYEEGCFYLPGENVTSATLDVARTIARRAERTAVTLKSRGILKNMHILTYLNRLSDLLYLMARANDGKPKKV
jgi:ATP:cob(I)alamin adenosyltransferase